MVVAVTIFLDPATAQQTAERAFIGARDYDTGRAKKDSSHAIQATESTTPSGPAYVVADAGDDGTPTDRDQLWQGTRIENTLVTVQLFEKREAGSRGALVPANCWPSCQPPARRSLPRSPGNW
ncbi:hypothetical protein Aph02nite_45600 [Actinoplanes philippinensis]|uniref:Uncharacterized protein n=1 Tax=Actinoplanes philippinensis TaxID=35752 RepID=A0A1I2I6X3_9ACTN|nr:hypothetical protein [Actinoplanes philippinensis]GIE78610.1 hypothetical protein Aph02nite_45600 [Actinoplanes philippinensis]SFF37403.1 hypothetical protein SAMN05421541_109321 [Actinoplanes philippinensis]